MHIQRQLLKTVLECVLVIKIMTGFIKKSSLSQLNLIKIPKYEWSSTHSQQNFCDLSNSWGAFPLLFWGIGVGFFLVGWGGWDFEHATNEDRDGRNCTGAGGLNDSRLGVLQEPSDGLTVGLVAELSG